MGTKTVVKKPTDCDVSGTSAAYDDDVNSYYTHSNSSARGTTSHTFRKYGFNIPSSATIDKVIFSIKASTHTSSSRVRLYIDRSFIEIINQAIVSAQYFHNEIDLNTLKSEYDSDDLIAVLNSEDGFYAPYQFGGGSLLSAKSVEERIYDTYVTVTYTVPDYTITVNATEGGSVSGGGVYEEGDVATLTAIPNSGYRFVKWSDGVTTATRTVTVTGNATYTAEFEEEPPPEITAVSMIYLGKQISEANKVPVGESFIVSVELS